MAQSHSLSSLSSNRIRKIFARLPDPRSRPTRSVYPLVTLVFIALAACVSGANTCQEIAIFARTHRQWLEKYVDFPEDPNLSPSHDTFDRVLSALNPVAFQKCCTAWLTALHACVPGLIAVDGKVAREAMARAGDQGPLTLVSAWASENRICLGQVAGEAGSNELKAIPKLLELLSLEGSIVTMDALGCQKDIVNQIIEQKGDYVISVKGNQPELESAVQNAIEKALEQDVEKSEVRVIQSRDNRRGREELRTYVAIPVPVSLEAFVPWAGLKSLVSVTRSYVDAQGIPQIGIRYFISSLQPKVKRLAEAVRGHWKVENELHWILDVSFREDRNRSRKDNAQANLGVIRRMSLSMLKNATGMEGGIDCRRKQLGWDDRSRENVLFSWQPSED